MWSLVYLHIEVEIKMVNYGCTVGFVELFPTKSAPLTYLATKDINRNGAPIRGASVIGTVVFLSFSAACNSSSRASFSSNGICTISPESSVSEEFGITAVCSTSSISALILSSFIGTASRGLLSLIGTASMDLWSWIGTASWEFSSCIGTATSLSYLREIQRVSLLEI